MDIPKITIEESLRQCSKPTGEIGIEYGRRMNISHKSLIEWGFSILFDQKKIRGLRILDVGCGAGLAIKLLSEYAPDSKINGIDYSPEMVESAKLFNQDLVESGDVLIEEGSVDELPFENNQFDLVTATETVYFWPHLLENVKEVYRTLKIGGRFTVINEEYYSEKTDKLKPHYKVILESDYANFPAEMDLFNLFKNVGFKNIKIHSIPARGWIIVYGVK